MIDTRKLTRLIIDKEDIVEDELKDRLNLLEEETVEEKYVVNVEEKEIKNLNTLLDYYDNLSNNVEKINFYKFVLYVMKDEGQTKKFFQELKNLSLLTHTGLLNYAREQGNYSKQVMSNFLLRLDKIYKDSDNNIIDNEISKVEEQLKIVDKYKGFFAPIGIVKEVDDAKEFYHFLEILKLDKQDVMGALLMTLNFNTSIHDELLNSYELNLQRNDEVIKKVLLVSNINKIKRASAKKIKEIVKDTLKNNNNKSKKRKVANAKKNSVSIENSKEPVIIENISEEDGDFLKKYALLEKANKLVRDNKDKDPYSLFVDYYDVLLSGDNELIIDKAKNYLKKNKKLISNLTDIAKVDLDDTLNVYMENEDLRSEVYSTTENIERLLTYEINKIITSSDDSLELSSKLKPIVEYIDTNLVKKAKKK